MKTSTRRLLILVAIWSLAATLAGSVHLIARLPALVVPVLVASLSIGLSIASGRVAWLREAIGAIGLRGLLAAHLVRFVGIYFLWLHAQGRMPAEFAYRAGWGDIATAVGAVGLLLWPHRGAGFRRALLVWNIFGLLDLLVAVSTGAWVNAARPGSMIEITGLPLAFVPLWLVPTMIAIHIVIFRRLADRSLSFGESAARLRFG